MCLCDRGTSTVRPVWPHREVHLFFTLLTISKFVQQVLLNILFEIFTKIRPQLIYFSSVLVYRVFHDFRA